MDRAQERSRAFPQFPRHGRRKTPQPVKSADQNQQSDNQAFNHHGPHPITSANLHVRKDAR